MERIKDQGDRDKRKIKRQIEHLTKAGSYTSTKRYGDCIRWWFR